VRTCRHDLWLVAQLQPTLSRTRQGSKNTNWQPWIVQHYLSTMLSPAVCCSRLLKEQVQLQAKQHDWDAASRVPAQAVEGREAKVRDGNSLVSIPSAPDQSLMSQ